MSNILYMAISQDGFIADANDKTPWSDAAWKSFKEFVISCDVILLGRRTFQIMQENDEFVAGPRYIVVTNNKDLPTGDLTKVSISSKEAMPKAKKLGIIGGGELNSKLAKLGVVDEIILDIEPIRLKTGIRLFGKYDIPLKLKLLGSKPIGDATVQRHYKVIK
jgi:dihydrofolate reductase